MPPDAFHLLMPDPATSARLLPLRPSALETPPEESLLGVGLALTDYERTLDWIDAAVDAREPRLHLRRRHPHGDGVREDPALRATPCSTRASRSRTASRSSGRSTRSATGSRTASTGPTSCGRRARAPRRPARACTCTAAATSPRRSPASRAGCGSRIPGLKIVGGSTQHFGEHTDEELDALAAEINAKRPDVVWVGLGVPRQEKWMQRMRPRLEAPVLSASARPSTSTPASSPRRPTGCSAAGWSGSSA